jgi:hypothetical protein
MRDLVILFVHVISTLARLLGPGGIRSWNGSSAPFAVNIWTERGQSEKKPDGV